VLRLWHHNTAKPIVFPSNLFFRATPMALPQRN